jgi:hypothetical protein
LGFSLPGLILARRACVISAGLDRRSFALLAGLFVPSLRTRLVGTSGRSIPGATSGVFLRRC